MPLDSLDYASEAGKKRTSRTASCQVENARYSKVFVLLKSEGLEEKNSVPVRISTSTVSSQPITNPADASVFQFPV